MEMHEALLTRGDVSGNLELTYDIMTGHNCVLVHGDTNCHKLANTHDGKRACVKNILKYNEYTLVMNWLGCMVRKMKSYPPREAINLVEEVYDEMQSMQ